MSRILLLTSFLALTLLFAACSDKDNPIKNNSPNIVLMQPANNSEFTSGETIVFQIEATDVEDGPITDSAISWESDKDGMMGYTDSIVSSSLSINVHNISTLVRDSQGGMTRLTFQIRIYPTK